MNARTHTLSSEMSRDIEMSRDHIDRAISLHVAQRRDGTLEVAGDIDAATSDVLDRALRRHERSQAVRRNGPPVVIDMRQVGFVDSSGLRTLVAASLRAGSRGTSVILRNTAPDLTRLLEITGLSRQFAVDPGADREDHDDEHGSDDDGDGVNETERRYGPDESPA